VNITQFLLITYMITTDYEESAFQEFIEKPREFIDIYGK